MTEEERRLVRAMNTVKAAQEAVRHAQTAISACVSVNNARIFLNTADSELRLCGYALEARYSEVNGVK